MGTNLHQSRSAASLLVRALLLLPCIVPPALVDAKGRAAHTKHHVGAAAAGVTVEELGASVGRNRSRQSVGGGPPKPLCRNYGQLPKFTGDWVDHPDADYRGIYNQASECPAWAYDFDCIAEDSPEDRKPALLAHEYRKVFRPHDCDLPKWDAKGFDKCLKGRRLIFIGDSLTRQMYSSLSCLVAPVTVSGTAMDWDESPTAVRGEYKGREWPEDRYILKQYWADVRLKNGGQIMVRCFGRYNASLWDDVFAEIGPLTQHDVIIVNFGAWYPRFNFNEPKAPFEAFKLDVKELFLEKLSKYPAQSYWRTYSPTHFGGATGTFLAVEEGLEGVPTRQRCEPASVGEFWYRDHVVSVLKECGAACKNIRLLPIFDMSLSRYDSHHGTYGRGKESGFTDCRHYCVNVLDWWNIVLYSMMCF
ncbi:g9208 [Coccomyxa elongata]